jgi:hypothetical protein
MERSKWRMALINAMSYSPFAMSHLPLALRATLDIIFHFSILMENSREESLPSNAQKNKNLVHDAD